MSAPAVVVTGATGFIGRRVVRALDAPVVAVVRPGAPEGVAALPRDTVVVEDPGDTAGLAEALSVHEFGGVVHLAAAFDREPRDPDPLVATNVGFASRFAEAVARCSPGAPFVNAATIWQHHGPGDDEPLTLYAATKDAFEAVLAYYAVTGLLSVRTVVVPDTYGPGDPRGKIVTLLVDHARRDARLEASSGRGVVDLLHVDDVAAGLVHALRTPDAGRWALSSRRAMTVRELADVVADVAGQTVDVEWGARPDRDRQFTSPPDAGEHLPGWRPTITLEDGVRQLLEKV